MWKIKKKHVLISNQRHFCFEGMSPFVMCFYKEEEKQNNLTFPKFCCKNVQFNRVILQFLLNSVAVS